MPDAPVFLKLGGSLITDKTVPRALRRDLLARLAAEIASALDRRPTLSLLLGHGSGSYGHFPAVQFGTRAGVHSTAEWRGFATVSRLAGELNRWVVDALGDAGVPAISFAPSSLAGCRDGELTALDYRPIATALARGLVPVVYGDVAFDEVRGGTIVSTEEVFRPLARALQPERILLAGEVDGVLSADPAGGIRGEVVGHITPGSYPEFEQKLGRSRGADVTGGMMSKVREMLVLLEEVPSIRQIRIFSGLRPDVLAGVLLYPTLAEGTEIGR